MRNLSILLVFALGCHDNATGPSCSTDCPNADLQPGADMKSDDMKSGDMTSGKGDMASSESGDMASSESDMAGDSCTADPECTAAGDVCSQDGTSIITCALDAHQCLHATANAPCGANKSCSGTPPACVAAAPTCDNNLVPGCVCPDPGSTFYLDQKGGSASGANPAPTGAQNPPACRYQALPDALAAAGAYAATHGTAKVVATGASGGTMTFNQSIASTPLTVPAGVTLTSDDNPFASPGPYVIALDDTAETLDALMQLKPGSALSHFVVSGTNPDSYAALLATDGPVSLAYLEVKGSSGDGIDVSSGSLDADNLDVHDNHNGIYVYQAVTTVSLTHSRLHDNSPGLSSGSGLKAEAGAITISETSIDHNWDGIDFGSGSLTVGAGCKLSNNTKMGLYATSGFDYSLHNLAPSPRAVVAHGSIIEPIEVIGNGFAGIVVGNLQSYLTTDAPTAFDGQNLVVKDNALYGLAVWNAPATDHAAHPVVVSQSSFINNGVAPLEGYSQIPANIWVGRAYTSDGSAQTVFWGDTISGGQRGFMLTPANSEAYAVQITGVNDLSATTVAGLYWTSNSAGTRSLSIDHLDTHDNSGNGWVLDNVAPSTLTLQANLVHKNTLDQVVVSGFFTTSWNLSASDCSYANRFYCAPVGKYALNVTAAMATVTAGFDAWANQPPTNNVDYTGATVTNACPAVACP